MRMGMMKMALMMPPIERSERNCHFETGRQAQALVQFSPRAGWKSFEGKRPFMVDRS